MSTGVTVMRKLDRRHLVTTLWLQLPRDGADWLKTALHQLVANQGDSVFENYLKYSAMTKRKLGADPLTELPDVHGWQVDEVARLLLLFNVLEIFPPEEAPERVKAAFKYGDECEQIAIIKGLSYLDEQGALADLAISTGRTNSLNLFAAIALNNDYPAQHYDKRAYHQLVLKALFMDLDIGQIVGLQQHHCVELSCLAIDLVNERLAADRQPPGAIWQAIVYAHLNRTDQAIYRRFSGASIPGAAIG